MGRGKSRKINIPVRLLRLRLRLLLKQKQSLGLIILGSDNSNEILWNFLGNPGIQILGLELYGLNVDCSGGRFGELFTES